MQIITLTTDTGLQDYYVAAIKGEILKDIPNANIIDISHTTCTPRKVMCPINQ
jgi:S-adenosylmethionine hydrolase